MSVDMNTIKSNLTDQIIAIDMLNASKSGIKSCAAALSETATPQVRTVLRKQLDQAITGHETLTNFMMSKGWYDAFNPTNQIKMDLQNAQTALNLT
jgi:similar to spore coat protein